MKCWTISVLILHVAVTCRLVTSQAQATSGGAFAAVPVAVPVAFPVVAEQPVTDTCATHGDIIFLVDRSSGQSDEVFGVVKNFLTRFLTLTYEFRLGDCFRTALVSFSEIPEVEYGFMSGNLDMALTTIDAVKNPEGQGFTHKALLEAITLFENDENPSEGNNKIVMLFTDGDSNDKTATVNAAKNLKTAVGAKVLIGKSIDPEATPVQQLSRDGEINGILAKSVCGSEIVYEDPLDDDLADGKVQEVVEKVKKIERVKNRYLCNPSYSEIDGTFTYDHFDQEIVYAPDSCHTNVLQECACELEDGELVQTKYCRSGACSWTGCQKLDNGEILEYEGGTISLPNEVCEEVLKNMKLNDSRIIY